MFFIRQQEVCSMFESLSKTAQAELEMQKGRRVTHFQKSLQELAELEVCIALKKLHLRYIWAITIPGETCEGSCSNAEADNKCHQDRGVRLKNGPYSASNELDWNADSDSSKTQFVNCLDCLQSDCWWLQGILWTYLYLWAFSTVIRKVMIWATKC